MKPKGETTMSNEDMKLSDILDELRRPFHPSQVQWKPGAVKGDRAMALAYADLRAYMNRLDEVCGSKWSVVYEPWGEDRIICKLTIMGVTRSSTGETTNESEKGEIGGTVAEAQSFKRAAVMFGLSRYLYQLPSGWVDYDPATKKFTEGAKAKLTAILTKHYRKAVAGAASDVAGSGLEGKPAQPTQAHQDETSAVSQENLATEEEWQRFDDTGKQYYGEMKWPAQIAKWTLWASKKRTSDPRQLTSDETENAVQTLFKRIEKAVGEAEMAQEAA